jgi:hypothetical protein
MVRRHEPFSRRIPAHTVWTRASLPLGSELLVRRSGFEAVARGRASLPLGSELLVRRSGFEAVARGRASIHAGLGAIRLPKQARARRPEYELVIPTRARSPKLASQPKDSASAEPDRSVRRPRARHGMARTSCPRRDPLSSPSEGLEGRAPRALCHCESPYPPAGVLHPTDRPKPS